ncbi:hypothetical protein QBC43DRAFT_303495 [Cladorrhinum sp. PSN259]|nr:hypothetical protein QBC43DRAFT_303495 [Cladorrhinum sp. PSN259]
MAALVRALERGVVASALNRHAFIPLDVLDNVITIDSIIMSLGLQNRLLAQYWSDKLPTRIHQEAKKLFTILVLIGQDSAIQELLSNGLSDKDLPLARKDNTGVLMSKVTKKDFACFKSWSPARRKVFLYTQWLVQAPVIERVGQNLVLDANCPLPFIRKGKTLGGTYRVDVYQAHIHPAHRSDAFAKIADGPLTIKETNNQYSETVTFIRKSFHTTTLSNLYAIFPWANGGHLEQFWERQDNSQNHPELIMWSLEQALGLADAIRALHGSSFRHGGIKPQQVLHFYDKGHSKSKRLGKLVLDVGMSQLLEYPQLTNVRHWVTRTTLSICSYEAPEAEHDEQNDIPPSQKYDQWSLGCMFLEFSVWLLYGFDAVQVFRRRGRNSSRDPTTVFGDFFTQRSDGSPSIHPRVSAAIVKLREDPRCGNNTALGELVTLVEDRLLQVSPHDRADADELQQILQSIVEKARNDVVFLCKQTGSIPAVPRFFVRRHRSLASSRSSVWSSGQGTSRTRRSSTSSLSSVRSLGGTRTASIDDQSDVESIFSEHSVSTLVSSQPSQTGFTLIVILELSDLLSTNPELQPLYPAAMLKVGDDKLERNLRRLLRSYSINLKAEAVGQVQLKTAGFLRGSRRRIAAEIVRSLRPTQDKNMLEELDRDQTPKEQESNKKRQIDDFLKSLTTGDTGDKSSELSDSKPTKDVEDDSSDESEPEDEVSFQELKQVREFLISAAAFQTLKKEFRQWLNINEGTREPEKQGELEHAIQCRQKKDSAIHSGDTGSFDGHGSACGIGPEQHLDPKADQDALGSKPTDAPDSDRGPGIWNEHEIHCMPMRMANIGRPSLTRRCLDVPRRWVEKQLGTSIDWWPLPGILPVPRDGDVKLIWEYGGKEMWIIVNRDLAQRLINSVNCSRGPTGHPSGSLPPPNTTNTRNLGKSQPNWVGSSKAWMDSLWAQFAWRNWRIGGVNQQPIVLQSASAVSNKEAHICVDRPWKNITRTNLHIMTSMESLLDDAAFFMEARRLLGQDTWLKRLFSFRTHHHLEITMFHFLSDNSRLVSTSNCETLRNRDQKYKICNGYEYTFRGNPCRDDEVETHLSVVARKILHGIELPSLGLNQTSVIKGIPKWVVPPNAKLEEKEYGCGWGFHARQAFSVFKAMMWFFVLGALFAGIWLGVVDKHDLQNASVPILLLFGALAICKDAL